MGRADQPGRRRAHRLDFTVVPFTLLEGIGYRLTDQEQSHLYRYRWYVGHLLGLGERFFLGIEDHEQARELLDLLDSTSAGPDENSRAVVQALFAAATANLAATPGFPMDAAAWRDLLHAVVRAHHGEDTAAALGVPESPFTPLLPLLAAGEAKARRYQLQVPGALQQAAEDGIAARRGFVAALTGSTAYQDHAAPA